MSYYAYCCSSNLLFLIDFYLFLHFYFYLFSNQVRGVFKSHAMLDFLYFWQFLLYICWDHVIGIMYIRIVFSWLNEPFIVMKAYCPYSYLVSLTVLSNIDTATCSECCDVLPRSSLRTDRLPPWALEVLPDVSFTHQPSSGIVLSWRESPYPRPLPLSGDSLHPMTGQSRVMKMQSPYQSSLSLSSGASVQFLHPPALFSPCFLVGFF